MREDMHKVIVEHPRAPGGKTARNVRRGKDKFNPQKDPDSYLSPSTRRKVLYRDYKTFRDYLNPLRRYIEAQCGRPWRKVYSEIRKQFGDNSTLSDHLREHIRMEVCTDLDAIEERLALPPKTTPYLSFNRRSTAWTRFYVDRHGLLKEWPERQYVKRETVPEFYQDMQHANLRYYMIAGCWHVEDSDQIRTRIDRRYGDYVLLREPMRFALSTKEIARLQLHGRPIQDLKPLKTAA